MEETIPSEELGIYFLQWVISHPVGCGHVHTESTGLSQVTVQRESWNEDHESDTHSSVLSEAIEATMRVTESECLNCLCQGRPSCIHSLPSPV